MKNKTEKILAIMLGTGLLVVGPTRAEKPNADAGAGKTATRKAPAPKDDVFYVYKDRGSRLNHFIPSGWMGDYGDLKMNQGWTAAMAGAGGKDESKKGGEMNKSKTGPASQGVDTCIQIKYSAERKQGAGWAGIYWQTPANNWGDKPGGFDLSAYKKLKFRVRGENGGEVIDKFFVGGITGQTEEGDSDEVSKSPVELTKDWQDVELDLSGADMSHIIGGFGFAANADANPNGFTMYLDDVRFTKS